MQDGKSSYVQLDAVVDSKAPALISPLLLPVSGGDYQPDRPIGYGAFGVVWSVTDPRDGKRVALKKLPNVFQSLVSSKRVFRELRMMRFFKHENVLSCLDILQVRSKLSS